MISQDPTENNYLRKLKIIWEGSVLSWIRQEFGKDLRGNWQGNWKELKIWEETWILLDPPKLPLCIPLKHFMQYFTQHRIPLTSS